MDNARLSEIQAEHRAWAIHNFGSMDAPPTGMDGIVEELGECAHARLKGRQGIRGSLEKHVADEQDAIADCMVFLMDFASRCGQPIEIRDAFSGWRGEIDANGFFLHLASRVGELAEHLRRHGMFSIGFPIAKVAESLAFYAELRGWDLLEILERTWAEVKQRDWKLYPQTGRPPTE